MHGVHWVCLYGWYRLIITRMWLKLSLVLTVCCSFGHANPGTHAVAVTFEDMARVSIDWTSNHDPFCLFELGGRHRLKDISCEESAWCWDFIRWTFEKKSTSAALHIDLELKTKWTFAQLEFRDTASEDFFFNVTVCKLDSNQQKEILKPTSWFKDNPIFESLFELGPEPSVFLFQSTERGGVLCGVNIWCKDLIWTNKTGIQSNESSLDIVLNATHLNSSSATTVCVIDTHGYNVHLYSLEFLDAPPTDEVAERIMSVTTNTSAVFTIPMMWTKNIHSYMYIFKETETVSIRCKMNTFCGSVCDHWDFSGYLSSTQPTASVHITVGDDKAIERYTVYFYDDEKPSRYRVYELITVMRQTIPSPLVIKPLNSSVEEFAAYDIDADTDFAPEMFFFEDLNKNGYHCDWRKSCLEFRLTFEPTMKGSEPSIIGILVLLEGQDFIHTTVISVAGQTISSYVLLSNRQESQHTTESVIPALPRESNLTTPPIKTNGTKNFKSTVLTALADGNTNLWTMVITVLAIVAGLSSVGFIVLLYIIIRTREKPRNQTPTAAIPAIALQPSPSEDNRQLPGIYDELPSRNVSYDDLGDRCSDYECLTDLDLSKETGDTNSNLMEDPSSAYQSIHSKSSRLHPHVQRIFPEGLNVPRSETNSCGSVGLQPSEVSWNTEQSVPLAQFHSPSRCNERELSGRENSESFIASPQTQDPGDGDYLTVLDLDEEPVIYLELREF